MKITLTESNGGFISNFEGEELYVCYEILNYFKPKDGKIELELSSKYINGARKIQRIEDCDDSYVLVSGQEVCVDDLTFYTLFEALGNTFYVKQWKPEAIKPIAIVKFERTKNTLFVGGEYSYVAFLGATKVQFCDHIKKVLDVRKAYHIFSKEVSGATKVRLKSGYVFEVNGSQFIVMSSTYDRISALIPGNTFWIKQA